MLSSWLIAGGVVVVFVLWRSGNLGKVWFMIKGMTTLFVERPIQTLEGLEAAYTQAISETEDQYRKIAEAFKESAGEFEQLKNDIEKLEQEKKAASSNVDKYILAGDDASASVWAIQYEKLNVESKEKQLIVPTLGKNVDVLKQTLKTVNANIEALKLEKSNEMSKMRANLTVEKANQRMANLSENIDVRVLEVTREGARVAEARALGSTQLNELTSSAKIAINTDTTAKLNASSYLEKRKADLLKKAPAKASKTAKAAN